MNPGSKTTTETPNHPRPRRSLFFVPGGESRKLEKSMSLGADTLLFDLEDAVAVDMKEKARSLVAELLRDGDFGGAEAAVRINAPGTRQFEDDLRMAVEAGAHAVMLPKAESAVGIADVADRMQSLERETGRVVGAPVRLLALVESATGIAQLREISLASDRIEALCFGHLDFSRDMEMGEADASNEIVLHARCEVAITARAAGLAPIDTICTDFRDDDRFRTDAKQGLRLGFAGKLCIHPRQVPIANEVFAPTPAQIEFAERVLDGWERALAEGRGVFALDGKMMDAPLVAVHRRVLEQAAMILELEARRGAKNV